MQDTRIYDFDCIVDRKGTDCWKYDSSLAKAEQYSQAHAGEACSDPIELWIADMDFQTPDFIVDAIKQRAEHPVFGYGLIPDDYFGIIQKWVEDTHGWHVERNCMKFIPGIVRGIGMVLNGLGQRGDKVIIQSPVYHPFRNVPEKNGFQIVTNPLIPVYNPDGTLKTYEMDLDGFEQLASRGAKFLILSNPHNPCGICWRTEQLIQLAKLAKKYGVVVISDEIHCEMVHNGKRHVPFASVCQEAADCSITFMAPSKTFNIAGIVSSYAIVLNKELKEKFFHYLDANEFDAPTIFSVVATRAAYLNGAQWRLQLLDYLKRNMDYVADYLSENIPDIHAVRPDASFLVWLDCRKFIKRYKFNQKDLVNFFKNKAGLVLNDGTMFGEQATGFMRMNIGCPKSVLETAMNRLSNAIKEL